MAASNSTQRYMVTARKYRPARFHELVAQEHVSDTLKNAIRLDRLAHAYLFSGPRGVGKTTAARILAKAINCTTPLDERDDGAEPCRTCDSCRSFEEGRSLGIFEIDAASNNKVDDIRELRETVRVPPQGSKKKVYIIDEVHMLSNQAFNALLKTLEEPPPHVLFIFATTEPHKVLPTILSRCQRFDFRRIPVPEIVERLREICQAEDIEADEESLMLIAKKGDGALRDALSAFDQAVSLCGTTLTYRELVQALGVVDLELFFRLTEHIAQHNASGVLELVEEVVQSGYDLQEFLAGVAEHMRNLLVAITMEDTSLIQAARKTRERYANQSGNFSESDVLRLLMIAGGAEEDVKASAQPRLKLEMALLKMASLTRVANLEQALGQLNRIEKALDDGDLSDLQLASDRAVEQPSNTIKASPKTATEDSDPSPSSTDDTRSAQRIASTDQSQTDSVAGSNQPKNSETSSKDGSDETDGDMPDSGAPREQSPRDASPDTSTSPPSESESITRDRESRKQPSTKKSEGSNQSSYQTLFNKPALGGSNDDSSGPKNSSSGDGAVAVLEPPATTLAEVSEGDAEAIAEHWDDFVSAIHSDKIMLASYLRRSRILHLQQGDLHIALPDPHSRDLLRKHEQFLVEHLPDEISDIVEGFEFVIQNDLEDADIAETDLEKDPYELLKRMRKEHDVVRALFDKFGGEIVP